MSGWDDLEAIELPDIRDANQQRDDTDRLMLRVLGSEDGMKLIEDIRTIYDNYDFKTQILAASVRHPMHFVQAALAGADVATIPYGVFKMLYKHPLTDSGLEKFLADWKKAKA